MPPTSRFFVHRPRGLEASIRVDDILAVGDDQDLKWLEQELRKIYELKVVTLGPDEQDVREAAYLGRTIRWTDQGIEIEGDPKHLKELLRCVSMQGCRAVGRQG